MTSIRMETPVMPAMPTAAAVTFRGRLAGSGGGRLTQPAPNRGPLFKTTARWIDRVMKASGGEKRAPIGRFQTGAVNMSLPLVGEVPARKIAYRKGRLTESLVITDNEGRNLKAVRVLGVIFTPSGALATGPEAQDLAEAFDTARTWL